MINFGTRPRVLGGIDRPQQENWKKQQEDIIESKRRDTDKAEAFLQRQLRAETIKRANDKLYEQTGKMKLLRSNLLYAEVIEASCWWWWW